MFGYIYSGADRLTNTLSETDWYSQFASTYACGKDRIPCQKLGRQKGHAWSRNSSEKGKVSAKIFRCCRWPSGEHLLHLRAHAYKYESVEPLQLKERHLQPHLAWFKDQKDYRNKKPPQGTLALRQGNAMLQKGVDASLLPVCLLLQLSCARGESALRRCLS